jgi:AbrB family looped-hinge helix DNA binding protein
MVTTIDAVGRVVIPKAIRERLGLRGGTEIAVELVAGHIEIHLTGPEVRIEEREDGPVLVPEVPVPTLTIDDVRSLVEEDRYR